VNTIHPFDECLTLGMFNIHPHWELETNSISNDNVAIVTHKTLDHYFHHEMAMFNLVLLEMI
jgi:hypothetical protein